MAIKKVRGLESNFSILPNSVVNDNLSWAAKGMLAYLLSKPEGWQVSVQQLINHSQLSSRPTKRDGTYAIINELMDKGYMMRERTSGGGYSKTNYIVSSIPEFSNKPLTDYPDTVEPTQESKVFNKGNIKEIQTISEEMEYFVYQLNKDDYQNCYSMIEEMNKYGDCFYTGKLKIDEWYQCESQMTADSDIDIEPEIYVRWFVENRISKFKKKPSLPNMITDMNSTSFVKLYNSISKWA